MSLAQSTPVVSSRSGPSRALRIGLGLVAAGLAALAIRVVAVYAARYVQWEPGHYGRYWPLRGWLVFHVGGALLALACGPLQLWSGWRGRTARAHRLVGRVYLAGVAIGSVGALGISLTSPLFPTLGIALTVLDAAWLATTGLAYFAIRRGAVALHRELMLWSYVITFAFVVFRTMFELPILTGLSQAERFTAIGWLCWTVPLILTEVLVQGRRLVRRSAA